LPKKLRKELLYLTVPYMNKEFFDEHVVKSLIFQDFFDAKDLNSSLAKHFQWKLEHLLKSEDRNSMAFSLEARVPYLDHRLVEYLLSLQDDLKIDLGETKYLEKVALGHFSTEKITKRKDKKGFETPMKHWMKESRWKDLGDRSFARLQKDFPDVFASGRNKEPRRHESAWKMISLSKWQEMYL